MDETRTDTGRAAPRLGPPWLQAGAAVSARLLIVGAAVAVAVYCLVQLRLVVFPLIAALLLVTLLDPLCRRLVDRGVPPALSALLVLLALVGALAGAGLLLVPRVVDQLDQLDVSLRGGLDTVEAWLMEGPLGLSEGDVASAAERLLDELREQSGALTERALSGAIIVAEVLAGLLLALVLAFFLLKDGRETWEWLVGLLAPERRERARAMGDRAWETLGGYLRGITVSALLEALMVAVVLLALGVPLVLPLAVLTFLGAYIPLIGAFVVGLLASLVALFSEGFGTAVAVVAAYTAVQQIEANLLHPVIVGRSVEVHPLAILLAVTSGGVLAGIPGAFLAVPAVAVAAALLAFVRDDAEAAPPA